jgi:hypothetical protein
MVDSSTKAGADWMVSCYTEIEGDMLLPLSQGLDRLLLLRSEPGLALQGELEALEELISSTIRLHTLPPVAIGAGASSLSHKAHGLLHQLRLEQHSWLAVRLLRHQCTNTVGGFIQSLYLGSQSISVLSFRVRTPNHQRYNYDLVCLVAALAMLSRRPLVDSGCLYDSKRSLGNPPSIGGLSVIGFHCYTCEK